MDLELQERNSTGMDKLYSPATAKKIINKYDFRISKSLGQNFLTDRNIVENIIRSAGIEKEDLVIEVGPGMGVLTAAAAERARRVIGIEIDENLIPILKETLKEYDNVRIIRGDFLKMDLSQLIREAPEGNREGFANVKLIGNLPYYITSPIIMKVLEEQANGILGIQSLTIMMQKEVADRIRAVPGTKAYGALSVAVQYYCTVDMVAVVSKEVFIPKPKVDCSEGIGQDYSTAIVLNADGEQVAQFRNNSIKPYQYTDIIYALGFYYNKAMLTIEKASGGHSVIERLRHDSHYMNMTKYKSYDQFNRTMWQVGFDTNSKTKSIIVNDCREWFEKGLLKINSRELLEEMQKFVADNNGSMGAIRGSHDDLVMALCLAIVGLKSGLWYPF
jgi:ribosomal RNA small subunit methyltransferase A